MLLRSSLTCPSRCSQKPFNGETPHALLAGAFVTPAEIHFVRNHMPLPRGLDAAKHRWGNCLQEIESARSLYAAAFSSSWLL